MSIPAQIHACVRLVAAVSGKTTHLLAGAELEDGRATNMVRGWSVQSWTVFTRKGWATAFTPLFSLASTGKRSNSALPS